MYELVKVGFLALILEILISMTRTGLEGQLKQTLFTCNGKQKVIMLHDKTRQHVAKTVRERIENLGREV
jgi:hypothetical protein